MLFNSYVFIFAFLPLTLLLFHGLRRAGFERASISALTVMSLFFYGWWNPKYLILLVSLMVVNFALAARIVPTGGRRPAAARPLLILGLTANLSALGYFKYANFFVDNLNGLTGLDISLAKVVLPLGISFFTFQKIAFLVDSYYGRVDRLDLLDYSLFVSFFPQLIAGPIVHHSEVMPQFRKTGTVSARSIALGITIFSIGLAKKVLLADSAARFATPQFQAVAAGARLDLLAAWSAALSYTAQLYFDFSGYTDMAIGAGLLFGIRLPLNFASPYKSASITEFWRRWHITLSRFLRDYLYIPLGGNRKGPHRRYLNVVITMLLGGFWHGAGWTYIVWGALHGLYLAVNHLWCTFRTKTGLTADPAGGLGRMLAQAITFIAVVVAWVFFRSEDLGSAIKMLRAMAGANGLAVPASLRSLAPHFSATAGSVDSGIALLVAFCLLLITWLMPNTQQLTGYEGPAGAYAGDRIEDTPVSMRPALSARWAVAVACLFAVSVMFMSKVSEFIYFQF